MIKNQKKIYILPNRYGLTFGFGVGLMFLTSVIYANNLGYFLSFFLLSFGLIAAIQTHNNLRSLDLTCQAIEPAPVGGKVYLSMTVRNLSKSPIFSVHAKCRWQSKTIVSLVDVLPGGHQKAVTISFPALQRGLFDGITIDVITVYPFGIFKAWVHMPIRFEFFVYPSPQGALPLPFGRHSIEGGYISKSGRQGNDDFAGHRFFVQGESQRHVDWKVLARRQVLLLKHFESPSPRSVDIRWDSAKIIDDEQKLSQISAWIFSCHQKQCPFSLELPAVFIPLSVGPEHMQQSLRSLAAYGR